MKFISHAYLGFGQRNGPNASRLQKSERRLGRNQGNQPGYQHLHRGGQEPLTYDRDPTFLHRLSHSKRMFFLSLSLFLFLSLSFSLSLSLSLSLLFLFLTCLFISYSFAQLVAPHRTFIKQGPVTKICRSKHEER